MSASEAPASSPAPEVAPTASRASRVAGDGSASHARELGEHLAAERAVEERGGEQGGDAEATAYGSGERRVGLAERGPGGEPAGEHVVAQRRQARAAAEQPVEVGGGEPAVGGQVEAGRHRDPRCARRRRPCCPTVVARGSTSRVMRSSSSPTRSGSVADDHRAVGVRTEVGEGRPQRAGHAGRGRGDQPRGTSRRGRRRSPWRSRGAPGAVRRWPRRAAGARGSARPPGSGEGSLVRR